MIPNPFEITCALVTRGNVDLQPILKGFGLFDLRVWDNSIETDLGVYGRYVALESAETKVIYVQDDDVILPESSFERLLGCYKPGTIVANMPPPFAEREITLLGFGAVFDRDLPLDAFIAFDKAPESQEFTEAIKRRCSDVIFAALTPCERVSFPIDILSYAYGTDRMFKQPGHTQERALVHAAATKVAQRLKAMA